MQPASPAASPGGKSSGVLALLASSVMLPEHGTVAGAVDAVVGRATQLAASLSRRRSSGPPPPPLAVPVRLVSGEEAVLEATQDATLEELQQLCQEAVGVRTALQRLCVQEEPRDPGLVGLLRSTATHLSSRDRVARSLADWSSFFLLPEGVNRELKGQGLVSWAYDNVWQQLTEQPEPPGTVRVLVATLDGRRRCFLVRSSTSLRQLRREVLQLAAVPPDQQRFLVLQQRALTRPQRLAWALLRLLLAVLLWAGGWLAAAGRWLLGLPPASDVRLQLVTESGREVQLAVTPDMTLRQMQQLVWERHGEQLSLQQLAVSPARAQHGSSSSACSSPERGRTAGGGGWRDGGGGGSADTAGSRPDSGSASPTRH